ncbi:MAG: hypothetical protein K5840_02250, partial [Eubacterium sp.]|nr:hypothetical protein [Eubacterium sp.]
MIELFEGGAFLVNGNQLFSDDADGACQAAAAAGVEAIDKAEAAEHTIARGIMKSHDVSDDADNLRIKFDVSTSNLIRRLSA